MTGAAGGLGLSIIHKLCEEEHWFINKKSTQNVERIIVACAHRPDKEFETKICELEIRYNVRIIPKYIELTEEESIDKLLKNLQTDNIFVSILINNAGVAHGGFFQTTSVETIRNVYEINLISHILLTNLVLKDMIQSNFGVIVNVASIAGIDLAQGNSAYGTSKAAVIEWTRKLATEYRDDNIYAFAVAPGLADTRMVDRMESKALNNMIMASAMQRLANPSEIADVIIEGITQATVFSGQIIRIDGGENHG